MTNETEKQFQPYYPEAIKPQKSEKTHYAVVPEGHKAVDLRGFWRVPERIQTRPEFHRIEDFAGYLKQFNMKTKGSGAGTGIYFEKPTVWADLEDGSMEAVLDYPVSLAEVTWTECNLVQQDPRQMSMEDLYRSKPRAEDVEQTPGGPVGF